jgi:hypothetical protein
MTSGPQARLSQGRRGIGPPGCRSAGRPHRRSPGLIGFEAFPSERARRARRLCLPISSLPSPQAVPVPCRSFPLPLSAFPVHGKRIARFLKARFPCHEAPTVSCAPLRSLRRVPCSLRRLPSLEEPSPLIQTFSPREPPRFPFFRALAISSCLCPLAPDLPMIFPWPVSLKTRPPAACGAKAAAGAFRLHSR